MNCISRTAQSGGTTRTLFSYVGLIAGVAPAAQEDLPGWIDSPARKI
ncbi:hypothetical protein ACFORO_19495 [Amycolatopsis halotolerans]|uniref:Uncharacterized protein n=1 Tax=Amycolatopsis halotolerans TaxID=330083 RepID=A0ABV7QGY9_9PSEU